MTSSGKNDPLHGITLERIVTELVARHGWDELGRRTTTSLESARRLSQV